MVSDKADLCELQTAFDHCTLCPSPLSRGALTYSQLELRFV